MHHKRLHDRNRQSIISDARSRALAKKESLKKQAARAANSKPRDSRDSMKWTDRANLKERGLALRGRSDARRMRARSRWMTVAKAVSAA